MRLELVQAPPPSLSPVAQMLIDQKKAIMPRRARF